ncbi:DUF3021 domain-containing protein [Butyrivibrio fibrisolvens]|uniref:DUF3021 domain-containing protein n=1 Tax=Butyrivibrio fibrisolvens TaxID=831 RepID=UPI00041F8499|nr:DUF3021 domain-containing protein [Butyrivibrio fibrisolvens]
MREVLKRAVLGIGIAMCFFSISGMIFDIAGGGNFELDNYRFTKMVIGCIIVGLGFGVPTIIYKAENIPMPIRILIHLGIGSIIYTVIAFQVGWAGTGGLWNSVIAIVIQLLTAFAIWFFFMLHYRNEAKRINDKIQAMK